MGAAVWRVAIGRQLYGGRCYGGYDMASRGGGVVGRLLYVILCEV